MITIPHLWLPIVLSAVIVFVASSVLHMVLKYHNADYKQLSNEDEVRAAIREGNPGPGQYVVPFCPNMSELKTPAMTQKFTEGPVGLLLLRRSGPPRMGGSLVQWFVLLLVISIFAAYVAGRTLAPGTDYLAVFRIVGSVAIVGYAVSAAQSAIWRGMPWSAAIRDIIDGIIYGLLTAGTFGWLWPK